MIKQSNELTGMALNWAVATAMGLTRLKGDRSKGESGDLFVEVPLGNGTFNLIRWSPSTNWGQAGPIIEECGMGVYRNYVRDGSGKWEGYVAAMRDPHGVGTGSSMCEAAMRCFVAGKLGEEVDIPEEYCDGPGPSRIIL